MSNQLPLTVQMGALPPSVSFTPQQLADAIAARLSIVTQGTFALFVTGSTEPTSNVGPWLKNGTEWWVWSNGDGAYIPQTLAPESLGYTIGPNPPDQNVYSIWIETAAGGSPLAVKIWYSGAWVDVYATLLANTLSNYSTTTAMNAAIAAAVGGATFPSYPAQATIETTPQAVPVDGAAHKVIFETAPLNPAPAPFNVVASRYVAPAAGVYSMGVSTQFDNDTGTAASMQVLVGIYKNGVDTGFGDGDGTPSPVGSRWYPGFGGQLISLAINDYLEVWVQLTDGVNTGSVDLTTIDFSVVRVSS